MTEYVIHKIKANCDLYLGVGVGLAIGALIMLTICMAHWYYY